MYRLPNSLDGDNYTTITLQIIMRNNSILITF